MMTLGRCSLPYCGSAQRRSHAACASGRRAVFRAVPSEHDLRSFAQSGSDEAMQNEELRLLASAEARFSLAQAAVADFERLQRSALDAAASDAEAAADAAVLEATQELAAANASLEAARAARDAAAAAAGQPAAKWATENVDDEAERAESGKAAVVGGFAAAAAAAPLSLASGAAAPLVAGLVTLGSAFASGALFSVVYRYALRRDLGNIHLKGGVVAAFGLVRGAAQVEALVAEQRAGDLAELVPVAVVAQAAALVGESVLLFALAGAALEACMTRGYISSFPKRR